MPPSGPLVVDSPADRPEGHQPKFHQLPRRRVTAHAPGGSWPAGIYAASSTLFHSAPNRVGAAKAEPKFRACQWSSGTRPKTKRSTCFRVIENRASRHRSLVPATGTLPTPESDQFVGALIPAPGTHEAVRPAAGSQVRPASLVAGKLRLKLT